MMFFLIERFEGPAGRIDEAERVRPVTSAFEKHIALYWGQRAFEKRCTCLTEVVHDRVVFSDAHVLCIDDLAILEPDLQQLVIPVERRRVATMPPIDGSSGIIKQSTACFEILEAMKQAKQNGEGATVYKGRLVDIASIKQAEVVVRQFEMISGE